MNARQLILAVADFFAADPTRWTQGAPARTATGMPIYPRNEQAVCFCFMGAAMKLSDGPSGSQLNEIAEIILPSSANTWADWNDAPGQTVQAIIDRCRKVAA